MAAKTMPGKIVHYQSLTRIKGKQFPIPSDECPIYGQDYPDDGSRYPNEACLADQE
jgi:hypothetical protein